MRKLFLFISFLFLFSAIADEMYEFTVVAKNGVKLMAEPTENAKVIDKLPLGESIESNLLKLVLPSAVPP